MPTITRSDNYVVISFDNDSVYMNPHCTERINNKIKLIHASIVPTELIAKMMPDEINDVRRFIGFEDHIDSIVISFEKCNKLLTFMFENGLQYSSEIYEIFDMVVNEERKSKS